MSVAAVDKQGGIHCGRMSEVLKEKPWPVEQERWRRHGWRGARGVFISGGSAVSEWGEVDGG